MLAILSSHGGHRSKAHTLFLPLFLTIEILSLSSLLAEANQASSPSHFSKFSRGGPSKEANNNILSFCKKTPHQAACESIFISSSSKTSTTYKEAPQTLENLFVHSVEFSISKAHLARALAYNFAISHRQNAHQPHLLGGINDCLELLEDSIDSLDNVIRKHDKSTKSSTYGHVDDDVQTWLSAALTNQETCLESLENDNSKVDKGLMETSAKNLSQFISNSLSLFMMTSRTKNTNPRPNVVGGRRLLSDDFPTWVSGTERKLLEGSVDELEAHAVVALDGSGTHKSIGEALGLVASLEESGTTGGRSVIHVKAGTYYEYIKIPTKQKNVMLIGDGLGKTIIVGSRSSEAGWTTYQSATVGKNLYMNFPPL